MANSPAVRILLADDHEVIRQGLRQLIDRHDGWQVCGEATTGEEATEQAMRLEPDIVILDVSMPGIATVEVISAIRAALPGTEILLFTMHEGEEMIRALLSAGARGYLLKSDPTSQILAAISALASGNPFFTPKVSESLREAFLRAIKGEQRGSSWSLLSPREREIIQLLAEGRSNKMVATALGIRVKTVETHRATIMRKLNINSVVELVHYAVRNKVISP